MRIGMIGINHKLARLDLREALVRASQRLFVSNVVKGESYTAILLTTCNRMEIYFYAEDLAETHTLLLQGLREEINEEFDQKVYSYFGVDCFQHLANVTAGLDSAIIAETEIQGQVKAAYENAAGCVRLPGELHYLFQKSLKIGKKVRSELDLGRGMPDLQHAVHQIGSCFFQTEPRILFIGASEVNCKILSFLKAKQYAKLTLCNRSMKVSEALKEEYQIELLPWAKLEEWQNYDWIIFGTKAPHYLVNEVNGNGNKKLVVDVSVPRNVNPILGRHPEITLLNIDQINRILRVRKDCVSRKLVQAEKMTFDCSQRYASSFLKRSPYLLQLQG